MLVQDSINSLIYDQLTASRLTEMLQLDDVSLTHEVFEYIYRQFTQGKAQASLSEAKQLISLLPRNIQNFPTETQILIAKIFLLTSKSSNDLPNYDYGQLEPKVTLEWKATKTQLQLPNIYAASLRKNPNHSTVNDLLALCRVGSISTIFTQTQLLLLLNSNKVDIRLAATKALGEPWALSLPSPESALLPLLDDESIAEFVITTLSRWKSVDFLIEFSSQSHSRYLKQHALGLIDKPLSGLQIKNLLDIALEDASFFGPVIVRVLRDQHRRQHNFSKVHIAALFQVFVLAPGTNIDDLSEIVRPSVKRWLHLLESLHPQNQSWKRQIALVGKINRVMGDTFLLARLAEPEFSLLKEKLILTLANNGCKQIEKSNLSLLEGGQTETALTVIKAVGGVLSKQCLWSHIDGSRVIAGLSKEDALSCVLSIEDNISEVISQIPLSLLSKDQFPLITSNAYPDVTDLLIALLDTSEKLAAIQQLGDIGGTSCLDALTEQLLLLDDENLHLLHQAIQKIGERLFEIGCLRPSLLHYAETTRQAGEWLLADAILNVCDGLNDELLIKQMETLSRLQCRNAEKRVAVYLKHKNAQVQKFAITCLCHNHCVHLSDQLKHFLLSDDIYTRRAAIISFAKMKATWMANEIATSLNHSNMNIKKAAAEALITVGNLRIVPLIIDGIVNHDNQGLKELLVKALKQIVGSNYVPLLIGHLSQLSDTEYDLQRQRRLLLALEGELSARVVVIAFQDRELWANSLMKLISNGESELRDKQGLAHLQFEAWRLNITLSKKIIDSLVENPRHDRDGWIECLLSDDQTVGNNEPVNSLISIESLSFAHIEKLKRQFPRLVSQLNSAFYGEASLSVLKHLVEHLSQGQKALLSVALLDQLDQARLSLESLLLLLKRCDGVLPKVVSIQALNTSSTILQRWALGELIAAEGVDKSLALSLLNNQQESLRAPLLAYILQKQWHEAALGKVITLDQRFITTLRQEWSGISNTQTIDFLLSAFHLSPDSAKTALLQWLVSLRSEKVDELLLTLLKSTVNRYRNIAEDALALRPSLTLQSSLLANLKHDDENLRQASANILLDWPSGGHNNTIALLYLQGRIRGVRNLRLGVEAFDTLSGVEFSDEAKKKYMALIYQSKLSPYEQLEHLWPLLDDDAFEVRAEAERVVRSIPAPALLSYLWPELLAGKWGYLKLLRHSAIQPELIELFETANVETQQVLLDHFIGLAKPVSGRRLLEALLAIQSPILKDKVIEFTGGLLSWQQPKERVQLLNYIQTYLDDGGDEALAVSALLEGIETLAVHEQLDSIQMLLNDKTCNALLPMWVEHSLQVPSAIENLPSKWHMAAHNQLIDLAQDRDEEKARGALKVLVNSGTEDVVSILEEALHHPKSRVRAYAHRLLRQVATKEYYLESTLILLKDKELALRCGAIRTLAFRGYLPAVKGIAEQLYVKKNNVNKVAKTGLLTMGNAALPELTKVVSHTRPDQRALLIEIIEEIREQ